MILRFREFLSRRTLVREWLWALLYCNLLKFFYLYEIKQFDRAIYQSNLKCFCTIIHTNRNCLRIGTVKLMPCLFIYKPINFYSTFIYLPCDSSKQTKLTYNLLSVIYINGKQYWTFTHATIYFASYLQQIWWFE